MSRWTRWLPGLRVLTEYKAAWFPHDVIAGAAIGIISSYIFTRPYHGWDVQLQADGKYYGFRLSRSF